MAVYTGESANEIFFTARRDEAKQLDPNYTEVEIPKNQKDLLPFLTELVRRHRYVPEREEPPEHTEKQEAIVPERERTMSHSEQRVAFDEEFEKFPLALQLHYASVATENAREQLRKPMP